MTELSFSAKKSIDRIPGVSPEDTHLLTLAEAYQQRPELIDALSRLDAIVEAGYFSGEVSDMIVDSFERIQAALDIVERSRATQEQFGLIDHRHHFDAHAFDTAFAAGRWAQELDVRFDKSGTPWVQHDPTIALSGSGLFARQAYIDTLDPEQIEAARPQQLTLESLLKKFDRYKDAHRLIIEIKSLGANPAQYQDHVRALQKYIETQDVQESIAFSAISPAILIELYKAMPHIPLMWNGGIVPFMSYDATGSALVESVLPQNSRFRAFGIGSAEVVVSAATEIVQRDDGHRKNTGYITTVVPPELLQAMQGQRKEDSADPFAGIISLSTVTLVASVIESLGMTDRAKNIRTQYAGIIRDLGLGSMASIHGDRLSALPGLRHLSRERQLAVFKSQLGVDAMVYTKDPEIWSQTLPASVSDLLQE